MSIGVPGIGLVAISTHATTDSSVLKGLVLASTHVLVRAVVYVPSCVGCSSMEGDCKCERVSVSFQYKVRRFFCLRSGTGNQAD